MASYHLTDLAAQDLADIHDYSCARWGEAQADRYLQSIYRCFESLVRFPDRDTSRHARSAPFRMAAVEQHFVLYDLTEDKVIILALFHQSQNVEKRIAGLTKTFRKMVAKIIGRT